MENTHKLNFIMKSGEKIGLDIIESSIKSYDDLIVHLYAGNPSKWFSFVDEDNDTFHINSAQIDFAFAARFDEEKIDKRKEKFTRALLDAMSDK